MNSDDIQTLKTFVKAASIKHPARLQYAKISDTLWSLYMYAMSKAYGGDVEKFLVQTAK